MTWSALLKILQGIAQAAGPPWNLNMAGVARALDFDRDPDEGFQFTEFLQLEDSPFDDGAGNAIFDGTRLLSNVTSY